MKKHIQHNLPVLIFQIFFLALALIFTLSFSSKGEKLENNYRSDYLASLEMSDKEELSLMEEIVSKERQANPVATPYLVKIYNQQGELVFEEKASNWLENDRINTYVQKSDFLMEVANEHYYLLRE